MNFEYNRHIDLGRQEFDRMIYIKELTQENEELRRQNRQLTKVLASKLCLKGTAEYCVDNHHTYRELRADLERAASNLLDFVAYHEGPTVKMVPPTVKGDEQIG